MIGCRRPFLAEVADDCRKDGNAADDTDNNPGDGTAPKVIVSKRVIAAATIAVARWLQWACAKETATSEGTAFVLFRAVRRATYAPLDGVAQAWRPAALVTRLLPQSAASR